MINLSELLKDLKIPKKTLINIKIKGITDNSKEVKKGYLFVCVKGLTNDGHDFINQAVEGGASFIIGERDISVKVKGKNIYQKVENSRRALSIVSASFYGNPQKKLKMIGVTGTKGKSTVSYLIYKILKNLNIKVGLISTNKALISGTSYDTGAHVTTPEPIKLYKYLKMMVSKGIKYCVLEVTSHGLDQERVHNIDFDISVLTNISHEHLDYHKNINNYINSKIKLLKNSDKVVLNKDCQFSPRISEKLKDKKISWFSLTKKSKYNGEIVKLDLEKSKLLYYESDPSEKIPISVNLPGRFNLENVLAAIAVARELDIKIEKIKVAIKNINLIPGRMQRIENKKGLLIYLDFAHTPDSLEKALSFLKKHSKRKLICVYGAAGERDRQKREMMGEISANIADISVITSEDPRSEDELDIISQIEKGLIKNGSTPLVNEGSVKPSPNGSKYIIIADRAEAILYSVSKLAKKGDTLVVSGKGHEQSMNFKGIEYPWSDFYWIKNALQEKVKDVCGLILAAGKGTRMNSDTQKALHMIGGRPMIYQIINNLRKINLENIVITVGYKKEKVIQRVGPGVSYATQDKLLGTGHSLKVSLSKIKRGIKDIIVVNADDSFLYQPKTLQKVIEVHKKEKAKVTFVSLVVENPSGLGRVIRSKDGDLEAVVEEKELKINQKKVKEVNIGFYLFDHLWVLKNVDKISKSKSGEYYIVDLIKIALDDNQKVVVYKLKDKNQWQGVNDKKQLEIANRKFIKNMNKINRNLVSY